MPSVREWIGDRHIHRMKQNAYRLTNKDFEHTIGVSRNAIEDDKYGVYAPRFRMMGRTVAARRPQDAYGALRNGFTQVCYDGQFFFDTDHPVLNEAGAVTQVSNVQAGSGQPWFLLALGGPVRPIILQSRKEFDFAALTDITDENVFMRREFLYGSHGRHEVGFGFWQTAYGSRAALTPTNYALARQAIMEMKGDYGRPLGLVPNLLVCGPANEGAARKILNNELGSGGETNEWRGTAELLVSPWLA
jgi:phage major head subunit gpT-like protein